MNITIYGTKNCTYCEAAKHWLENIGHEVEKVIITDDLILMNALIKETGSRTVPIIKIGDILVSGFDKIKLIDAFESAK